MSEDFSSRSVKDAQTEVLIASKESIPSPLKCKEAEVLTKSTESDSPESRNFGHCFVTWEIKNYGRALWQKNLKIETPEFCMKVHNTQETKWKLMLRTESNHKSLVEELKVNVNYKTKEESFDTFSKKPSKLKFSETLENPDEESFDKFSKKPLKFGETLENHDKEKFDLMCSLIDKPSDSELSIKNLMLHLERSKFDDGPSRVWVDWKVFYIGVTGEKCPLAHEEHVFTKKNGYGFNIGTLYDFEKDFEYNSNVMTILCEMIIKDVDTDIYFHDDVNIDLRALSEDLHWMFDQQKFCDAEIHVDGKKIKVHKAILCSHSNFFANLFIADDVHVIEMKDTKYDEVVKILAYIYSYDIKDVVGKPSLFLFDSAIQMKLKDLVDHYAPDELKIHTTIDVRKLTFSWTIQDFSTKISCISSPILSNGTDDAAWQIHLYPKGIEGNSQYIAVSVECIEGNISCDLCIQCAVLGENGNLNVWKTLRNSVEARNVFENDQFVERENAFKVLNNDAIRIGLKVRTCIGIESSTTYKPCTPALYSQKKSFENMVSNMLSLQESNKYTDAVLKFRQEEIRAHKCILSARSHLLARRLEKTDSVSFPKISPAIFKILLDYMYRATLNVTDIDIIIDVYKAAEEFVIPRLQEKCSRILQENVTLEKAWNILSLADEYYDEYLKVAALEFVKVNENMCEKLILEIIEPKTHSLGCEKEICKKSEILSVESVVKDTSVTKCTVPFNQDSIRSNDVEIDTEPPSARDTKTEQIGEKSRISVESIANKSESHEQAAEMSSTEIQKPVTCEMNIKSKMQTDKFDTPLKKRYSNETEFSKSSEEKEAVEQVSQSCEMPKVEQSEADLIKSSLSPSKNAAKEKRSQTACEIKNETESDEKNREEIFSSSKSP